MAIQSMASQPVPSDNSFLAELANPLGLLVEWVPKDRHREFPAMVLVGIVDAPWYGVKGTWAFEVRLEYTSGRVPSYGIWCASGLGRLGRELAEKQIHNRAEVSGGSVLMVYGVEYFSGEGVKHD